MDNVDYISYREKELYRKVDREMSSNKLILRQLEADLYNDFCKTTRNDSILVNMARTIVPIKTALKQVGYADTLSQYIERYS